MPDTDITALRKRARRTCTRLYDAAAADGEPMWNNELLDTAQVIEALLTALPKDDTP